MKFISIIMLCLCCNAAINAQEKYKLVWADEFSKDGAPDTANWNYERGFVRNHELQWYQPENAYCKNGLLVIEVKKEQKSNTSFQEGSANWKRSRKYAEYTSACLISRGKQQWQYGRFEMRARIDISSGIWPAWWTLGISKPWPENGEIDIMEYYRKMLLANIACLDKDGKAAWFSNRFNTDSLGGSTWSSLFHTWRMDWDEKGISLFLDDQLLNHVDMEQLENRDGSGFNPFKQPHYMLLNVAVGGDNGGDPSQTIFPSRFEVDWVRVYQK